MPKALPPRAQLEHQLNLARAAVILAEDTNDQIGAALYRERCDALLDRLTPQHVDI